ncbi:Riboflavin kinase [Rickettsiales bacterium Ac37b]|nr:Riboflavin kinase [Rickettsiales bacterium Ac37b]
MISKKILIKGKSFKGNQLGRKIGFPTINLLPPPNIILPKFGVYAAKTHLNNKVYRSIINIGIRPSINLGTEKIIVESHIFGEVEQDLYDILISVELFHFIREEKKFDNLEELKTQIAKDCSYVKTLFHSFYNL